MLLLLLMLFFSNAYNFRLASPKSKTTLVTIHLEKFNRRFNLLHIGISFDDTKRKVRFDYRSYYNNYNTYDYNHSSFGFINPTIQTSEQNIVWGTTNKTIEEILQFEKSLHKRYILGFNDCRHYVNRFTGWCLSNPTPIWKLHRVWNENENNNENAIENDNENAIENFEK